MASKRRLRRKSCTGKLRYERADAERLARRASYQTRSRISAYECWSCGGWHIGHTPGKVRRAMKAAT